MKVDASFKEVAAFHGHSCPGLAAGYRVATAAVEALELSRSADEELVAIVENNACGVDAIQYMLGCTFGKGNLIFHDYGKHVFTILRRDTGKGVRIVMNFPRSDEQEQKEISAIYAKMRQDAASVEEINKWNAYRVKKTRAVLDADSSKVLKIEWVEPTIPAKARVADSVACDACGEKTMATKLVEIDGKKLCVPCSEGRL